MGKKLQNRPAGISVDRNHSHDQGCMSGILRALQNRHWNHVGKKMLPPRRRRGVGHPGNDVNAIDAGEMQEQSDAKVDIPLIEESGTGPSQIAKSSMKSRIKAFISEEMLKRRKGRHQRSSSYPTRMQLARTDSIHHLKDFDLDPLHEVSNAANPRKLHQEIVNSSPSNSIGKQANELNMNRELLLKILLENTISPLALNSQIGYRKSVSFPLAGLGKRRTKVKHEEDGVPFAHRKLKSMEDKSEFSSPYIRKPKPCDSCLSVSPSGTKMGRENKLPRQRFRNLKQKIKLAMRESKKERHRITLDAVFHKVPYGCKFSDDEREELADFRKEKAKDKCSKFSPPQRSCFEESLDRYRQLYLACFNKEAKQHLVERLQLRREERPSMSGTSPKTMERILSLPDLRSYYYLQSEDYPDPTSSGTQNKTYMSSNVSKNSSRVNERKPSGLPLGSENVISIDAIVEKSGNENRSVEHGDSNTVLKNEAGSTSFIDFEIGSMGFSLDDTESLTTAENNEQQETIIYTKTSPVGRQAEPSPISVLDSIPDEMVTPTSRLSEETESRITPVNLFSVDEGSFQILPDQQCDTSKDSPTLTESKINLEKLEASVNQLNSELLRVLVTIEDVAEYNFVKYVLDLSGFSKNELLGDWHSPHQPLDPLMFDDYNEDQQGKDCNNLILFDLINQVLLEIYEKSFTYCPFQLCSISHIRPVPIGYHVLEEVWATVRQYLSWRPDVDQQSDEAVSRDLAKNDRWMNLHFEAECLGLELEDMIFEDLLEELIST